MYTAHKKDRWHRRIKMVSSCKNMKGQIFSERCCNSRPDPAVAAVIDDCWDDVCEQANLNETDRMLL